MKQLRCRIKSYIQPFERTLALRELRAVTATADGLQPVLDNALEYDVQTSHTPASIARQLGYWEVVTYGRKELTTTQSLREATVNVVRNGIDLRELRKRLPFEQAIPLPNRRCLRYGPHGIHEYRGKFFPQLVRSLINISGTRAGGIVADPMCGSGTTLVEAALAGCIGLGLDMNPLSILMSRTKCELLAADPKKLESAYTRTHEAVMAPERCGTPGGRGQRDFPRPVVAYSARLPAHDQSYLQNWFAPEVLAALDDIARIIQDVKYAPAQNLMWVALSNILRSVSWQKEDDLRVRKEVRLDREIDPKREFLEEIARSIRAVLAFLYQNGPVARSVSTDIVAGDARECATLWNEGRHRNERKRSIDVVITSPPYATALPYLDTDRLSLYYLGLMSRSDHRRRDEMMIGNREVTERLRKGYWTTFGARGRELPENVRQLISTIADLNDGADVGFRRKNMAALLAKYFFDMQAVLAGIRDILKPRGYAFVVVGNNHTIAGGKRVDICTASLLSEVASALGLEVCETLNMEMLTSRDIFRKNAMASEEILVLRKDAQS